MLIHTGVLIHSYNEYSLIHTSSTHSVLQIHSLNLEIITFKFTGSLAQLYRSTHSCRSTNSLHYITALTTVNKVGNLLLITIWVP